MDNKRLLIGMLLAMAVIFGWQFFMVELYKRHPEWKPKTEVAQPASAPASQAAATTVASTSAPSTTPNLSAPAVQVVSADTQPSVVDLGEMNESLPLDLKISSQGASVDQVVLKGFKSVDGKHEYIYQQPQDPKDPFTFA